MSKALQLVPTTLPALSEDSLDSYLTKIYAIPMLSPEEEIALATRFQSEGDLKAAQQLILSHLRYVVKIARQYVGYGLPLVDLIQEGSIGLMKAVKRFDPQVGVRLVSFAVHWIKSEIHEFVIRNWRIVKVATTKAQRKLFFNLRSQKKRLGWFTQDEIESVAQDLNVSPREVMEMEARMNAHDTAFDIPAAAMVNNSSAPLIAPEQYLEANASIVDKDPSIQLEESNWSQTSTDGVHQALMVLDERSQDIIQSRWLVAEEDAITLKELADKYNVSIERVRQLEKAALQKMRTALQDESVIN